jgi:hypothetical protein
MVLPVSWQSRPASSSARAARQGHQPFVAQAPDPGQNVTANVRAGFPVTLRPVSDRTVTPNRAAPTRGTLWPERIPDHRDRDRPIDGPTESGPRRHAPPISKANRRSTSAQGHTPAVSPHPPATSHTQPATSRKLGLPGPTDAARSAAPNNGRHPGAPSETDSQQNPSRQRYATGS